MVKPKNSEELYSDRHFLGKSLRDGFQKGEQVLYLYIMKIPTAKSMLCATNGDDSRKSQGEKMGFHSKYKICS